MTSICFFPVVTDPQALTDLVSRAAWFLAAAGADTIHIPVSNASLANPTWEVAPGMDPAIAERIPLLREKLSIVVVKTADELGAVMKPASVVLRWKKDARPEFVSAAQLSGWERGKKVFQVDPVAIRQEGSFYIEAGLFLLKNQPALIEENKRKFDLLAQRLGRYDRAYVMATGPSVASYGRFNYDRAITIVCNSVILDEALMDTAQPKILTFADPIFHFGPSQYAGAFRQRLRESAAKRDFTIFVPFKYYALFVSAMPELRDRTIAIPFAKDRSFNFNLRADFQLKTTANILTFLMLPLAATFADEVCIIGCDGRPLSENTYFWGHNPSTQINDKMANIREVHPGFFAIDYNDYYLEHCQTLEAQMTEGEAAGRRFVSIGFSHIPALRSRSGRGARRDVPGVNPSMIADVVIIDPDATSWSGHYMAYNDKLTEALEAAGSKVRVLCHRKIAPEILAQRPNFIPMLDTHSWSVGQAKSPAHFERVWTAELNAATRRMSFTDQATLMYLYTGSIEHARGLAHLAARIPSLYVHVNLFYLPFRDLKDAERLEDWRPFIKWLDEAGPRFVATVPTREVQADVLDAFGVILDVSPHPSTGVSDDQLGIARPPKAADRNGLRVLFPGAPRSEKGYLDALDCVRLLGEQEGIQTVIRHAPAASTPDALRQPPQDLPPNATVLEGVLSNEAYDEMFRSGDIVVLPYSVEAFGKRTSGLLIDALHHRMPAVVIEGTWLAAVVRQYGCGVIVPDGLASSLRDGVVRIAAEYDTYVKRLDKAAQDYFSENNWRALAEFIIRPLRHQAPKPPRLLAIDLTSFDGISATGRVKEAFFQGWDAEQFLLASYDSSSSMMKLSGKGVDAAPAESASLLARIREFEPELIYYRAVDNDVVHAFAMEVIGTLGKPYVVHMMDDWPERMRSKAVKRHDEYDRDLRRLFAGAKACLSIGELMSEVFEKRYGVAFVPFANAIDPASYPSRRARPLGERLRIVYTGALADDMTFESVKDVARAIAALPGEPRVNLEIFTREPWITRATTAFKDNPAVKINKQVPAADYSALLQNADVLLIAYNFDEASKTYVGLSRANKMPEYMAAGVPILAIGPAGFSTIRELAATQAARIVSERQLPVLVQAIDELRQSEDLRKTLAARARAVAFERSNVWTQSAAFRRLAIRCAGGSMPESSPSPSPSPSPRQDRDVDVLCGPFSREEGVHWDETDCVAKLFATALEGGVMIDVGAHHGSALAPFLARRWQVYAFEPDHTNRAVLLDNLESRENKELLHLDTRAVSNESRQTIPFFSSAQSTGISGLSAFHESHVQSQTVDTVTLADALADKPLDQVDFLKIDTEGHDLMVLQGFPWDRCKPQVIECEFEDSKTQPLGYTFDDLARFLVDKGYRVYVSEWHPIVRYGIRHDWRCLRRYPATLADPRSWGNLLAFRDAVDEQSIVETVSYLVRNREGKRVVNTPHALRARDPVQASMVSLMQPRELIAGTSLVKIEGSRWRIQPQRNAQGGSAIPWQAVFCPSRGVRGRTIKTTVTIESNRRVELRLGLCRHGETQYEGRQLSRVLEAGKRTRIAFEHRFQAEHDEIRLQLQVVGDLTGSELRIDDVNVYETMASVASRQPDGEPMFPRANSLFRDGEYATALYLYLLLADQRPLKMYRDNAESCARRMGWQGQQDPAALRARMA